MNSIFARKPLALILKEMEGEHRLKRVLGPVQLTLLGIGCIIGTGIFVLTGIAAHDKTGPALVLSFGVAGLACIFSALCYAEFAAMVPVAGSAYTYAYATLGELFAWIIGWDLVLEYTVASSSVAHGWSHYFQAFLANFGLHVPQVLSRAPFDFDPELGRLVGTGTWFDLPAIVITVLLTILLVRGIKESAQFNAFMVALKVAVVLFVVAVGAYFVKPENWHPFAPYGYTGVSFFGHTLFGQTGPGGQPLGMLAGSAMIFFAYIGFDSVSTQAEETKNPQRDVPIGIIASLIICTILYIAVAAVLTGMVPYNKLNIDAPVSDAFAQIGMPWASFIISIGAVAGMTSVLLVLMLSQPRIFLAMARDGMVPPSIFGAVHPRFGTPWKSTIIMGAVVSLLAALVPLRILAELVNIGTLLAFVIVCAAVLVMRKTEPDASRPFRCPLVPWVPLMGIAICSLLMFSLPAENWLRLIVWLALGFVVYFGYGRSHSVLAKLRAEVPSDAGEAQAVQPQ
ncbi:MAG: amino acid permease [Elusimicrobiota bacterium]